MTKLSTYVRWGVTMRAIEQRIPTSDAPLIRKESVRQAKDYVASSLDEEEEGYQPAIIAFEVNGKSGLNYGLALDYHYEDEEWVLEIDAAPDFSVLDHRRRPRARKGGAFERVALERLQVLRVFAVDSIIAALIFLYKTRAAIGVFFSRDVAKFLSDTRTMFGRGANFTLKLPSLGAFARGLKEILINPAEKPLNDDGLVVHLARTHMGGTLAFIGPLWSWEMPRPPYALFDGEWDRSWFGQVQ